MAACFNRYTFSHAMLRGYNLELFGVCGAIVVWCYLAVERKRVTYLESLLSKLLQNIDATPTMEAGAKEEAASATKWALRYLQAYSVLIQVAFLSVMLLVPFHLERPIMHFVSAGLAAGCMVTGICSYAAMPLGVVMAAAEGSSNPEAKEGNGGTGYLELCAKRHPDTRQKALFVIAVHVILPVTLAVHHAAWTDVTGRMFGACEVLAILSYQFFIASFARDEFASRVS
jgi:hypothetical protein